MAEKEILLDALNHIDPTELDYEGWRNVGMALQYEGLDCAVWDEWSKRDRDPRGRYHPGECEKIWKKFHDDYSDKHSGKKPCTGGTIIYYAQEQGWTMPQGAKFLQKAPEGARADTDTASDKTLHSAGKTFQKGIWQAWRYEEYVNQCEADVNLIMDYLTEHCGFTEEIIKRFHIGYDRKTNSIVYPYDWQYGYICKRNLDYTDREHFPPKYTKPSVDEAGEEPIYNVEALYQGADKPCFITEGAADALSIIQAGGNACSIIGTASGKLIDYISSGRPTSPLILCLDNDDEGEGGSGRAADALDRLGIFYITADWDLMQYSPDEPTDDPNSLSVNDSAQFAEDVYRISQRALEEAKAAANPLNQFIKTIYTDRYRPIPTGLDPLDSLLSGGLIRQTLVLLSAEPGAGKTALATAIFESMAKAGAPAIYFNLEMSREQLLARSIARQIYVDTNGQYKLTALDILQGYRQTEATKAKILDAIDYYNENIYSNLEYNPDKTGASVTQILKYISTAGSCALKEGKPAPNICIDYLHILQGDVKEDPTETIKRAVTGLKDYAMKYNAIVFCISAQSRQVNDRRQATMFSGRDTSAIEYSADLQMQLVERDNGTALFVTKSRFTKADTKTGLLYKFYGGQSYFDYVGKCKATDNEDDDGKRWYLYETEEDIYNSGRGDTATTRRRKDRIRH